jgi:hypothetical protein
MSSDAFQQSGSSPTPNTVSLSADFCIHNHGSIFLHAPQSTSARLWLAENVGRDNGYQPYWPTVVIEHRYIQTIVEGIQNDGLACEFGGVS